MRILFLILYLTTSLTIYSQNTFSYLGALLLDNNTSISFGLELIEKNGLVDGYSLTNIDTKDETKSEVSGLYFKDDKSFHIQETQVLSTESEAPLSLFCNINMKVSLKGKLGNKRLEGNFTGHLLDGSECANGKIILLEKERLKKKIKKIKRKIDKQIKKDKKEFSKILETKILREGDDFIIEYQNSKLKLYIWDAKEDEDRIQLIINGNIILDDYKTENKHKRIKYPLEEGLNIIEIKALDTGSTPPNTSQIQIIDNKRKYPIITQLEVGKTAVIKILK